MNDSDNTPEKEINTEEDQPRNLGADMLRMMEGLIADLKSRYGLSRRGWRGPTAQHNPSNLGGKGYTKPLFNFRRAKKRRKMAKASRRKNRRK